MLEALYEQLLSMRGMLRALDGQVTFLIDEVKTVMKEEQAQPAATDEPRPREKPPTFGSKREIEKNGE